MAGSLREALESAIEQHESASVDAPETVAPIDKVDAEIIQQSEAAGAENNAAAVAEDKAKADRTRDEAGRFAKEAKEKKDADPQKAARPAAASSQANATDEEKRKEAEFAAARSQQIAQSADGSKYPTTWKKGLEKQWSALAPEVRAEIQRREGNYASGVSTYKQEWDRAKPLIDSVAPFLPELQRYNIDPAKHIHNLFSAHRELALGSPEQKLQAFYRIAQDYQVPLQNLFTQGQDGKLYFNPNLASAQQRPQQQQTAQQPFSQADLEKVVKQQLDLENSNQKIEEFLSQVDKYPHAKEVAPTMAQLLEANLADDLPSAYDAALRLPQHAALYEADQKQVREAAEKAAAEVKRKSAEAARRSAVSPRSSTPTSVASASEGKKSLRDTIAAATDNVVGGRV